MNSQSRESITGKALIGDDLEFLPAEITIENGRIRAIEELPTAPDIWICPALFNAHTHLGDTVAMDCIPQGRDLVSLVTPPNGLKHQLLRQASRAELLSGIRKSIRFMMRRGIAGCADFREGGEAGAVIAKDAVKGRPFRSIILGRDGGEKISDGLGASSARDVADIGRIVAAVKKRGGLIAFHAGEKDSRDIDHALSFHPDFIVHATHATDRQLKYCAETGIPIVICPRSNWILSVTTSAKYPPVRKMLRFGCRVLLGTDNVMFIQPDLLSEMAFVHTVYHTDPSVILRMAVDGSSISGKPFFIRRGAPANLFVIDPRRSNLSFCRDPVSGIVKRGFSACICKNVFNL